MMTEEMIAWVRDNLQVLLHSPANPTPTPTPTLPLTLALVLTLTLIQASSYGLG